jgi:hypothetical protein
MLRPRRTNPIPRPEVVTIQAQDQLAVRGVSSCVAGKSGVANIGLNDAGCAISVLRDYTLRSLVGAVSHNNELALVRKI